MSDDFDPYDADRPLHLGCSCGRHASAADHAAATLRARSESASFEAERAADLSTGNPERFNSLSLSDRHWVRRKT